MSTILEKYNTRVEAVNSLLCVGLDSEVELLPERFRGTEFPQFEFNKWIIDETHAYAASFKPNVAFYEARGVAGLMELEKTVAYLREVCPDAVTICDAKRGDIGNTNRGYVEAFFDRMGFDSITLHPYMGKDSLAPFLAREDKACIILCRTSNPGAGEFQDVEVQGKPLWELVAAKVANEWNAKGNCMLVVGATYPGEMRRVREIAPGLTLLVPGIGAQGGDVAAAVGAGLDAEGRGMMLSSSRGILFAQDPASAAKAARDEINAAREARHAAH